ncbi:AAA family ATPase [Enterococcus sp. 2201sp1_2201st1_B8_2201SCRN_220225]|uniref:AAA family ATPase n=1 Tax=unclassified Enterococcus TaxID=2608891 RepID=UPI0034A4E9B6
MTQYSYSRVDLFKQCPHHFKLRYIDRLKEVPDYSPANPLIIGTALHAGIEKGVDKAIEDYYNSFPVITDDQVNEAIKLEAMIPKVIDKLEGLFHDCEFIHEYKIDRPEYVGFVDLIITDETGASFVFDFKYSNNIDSYLNSEQMHIYKYYLEQDGFKVDSLHYLFVEKVGLRKGKDEDIYHYRKRLMSALNNAKVTRVPIEYDESKVKSFLNRINEIEHAASFPRNTSGKCFACAAIEAKKKGRWTTLTAPDYLDRIQDENGEILMVLPSSERRNIEKVTKRVFWIYGAPFSGKTFFANQFPNPLMLNTDGNVKFVDAPYESIVDKVTTSGRVTNRKLAWEILDETVSDLEKGGNDFQTIIIDLLEDMYQACRFFEYKKLGIEHESDNSFKAWDIVRNTFLQMIKRIVHLPYENIIFISHEDISKDVTKKTGDKITSISPNLQDKAALKVAGMVDIVGRVVVDDDERTLVFKSKDYVFGGGRLPNLPVTEIPLEVDALMDVYDGANKNLSGGKKREEKKESTNDDAESPKNRKRSNRKRGEKGISEKSEPISSTEDLDPSEVDEEVNEDPTPARRKRRKKADVEVTDDETPPGEATTDEEPPKRKRRERKKEDEPVAEESGSRRRRRR